MTDKQLLKQIKELMQRKLLTQSEIDDPYYGEDGNMSSFEYGRPYGEHDLAEEVLNLMGVEIILKEGDQDEDEEED